MPTYEYFCPACGHSFNKLVPIAERDNVACPKCQNEQIKRLISRVAVKGAGSSSSSCNTCSTSSDCST